MVDQEQQWQRIADRIVEPPVDPGDFRVEGSTRITELCRWHVERRPGGHLVPVIDERYDFRRSAPEPAADINRMSLKEWSAYVDRLLEPLGDV